MRRGYGGRMAEQGPSARGPEAEAREERYRERAGLRTGAPPSPAANPAPRAQPRPARPSVGGVARLAPLLGALIVAALLGALLVGQDVSGWIVGLAVGLATILILTLASRAQAP